VTHLPTKKIGNPGWNATGRIWPKHCTTVRDLVSYIESSQNWRSFHQEEL
jgi:hypothetical protein